MASVVAFLTNWPRRHWSKEIAAREFSSIQSCPSSVIQKDEHSLALGSELLTTGSSGCSKKDFGPGRETADLEALVHLPQNEGTVLIKLSLGGLVQVWEAPKCLSSASSHRGGGPRFWYVAQDGPCPAVGSSPNEDHSALLCCRAERSIQLGLEHVMVPFWSRL